MADGGDVEIVAVVCNTQSANVRDNVTLCTALGSGPHLLSLERRMVPVDMTV